MLRRPRPTPVVLAAVVLVVLALGAAVALAQDEASTRALVGLAAVIAAGAIAVGPLIPPALPIGLGLLLAVFSGNWQYFGVPLGLDRPLIAYGIFLALLRLLPDARERWHLRLRPIHGLMLVVGLYGIGSAIAAGTFGQSGPTFALSERLGIFGFLIFLVAPTAFRTQRSRELLLVGFVVLGAYLGLTALLESTVRQLVFPRYIVDPFVGINQDRARGPFVESGSFGMALFTCGVMATIAFARWRRPAARAACILVVALCAFGVVATLTRQAWLGAVAGSLAALLVSAPLRRFFVPALVVGAAFVAVALVVVPAIRPSTSSASDRNLSLYDRLNSDRAALKMIEDRPLFGFGWYTFADSSLSYLEQSPNYPLRSVPIAHNVFLGFGSELGLVGAGLWLMTLLIVVGTVVIGRAPPDLEPWRIAVVAVTLDWFVVANLAPTGTAFTSNLLWVLPGIVWTGLPRHAVLDRLSEVQAHRGRVLAPLRTAPRVALLVGLALVGGGIGLALGQLRTPTYRASAELSVGGVRERSYDLPFLEQGFERWASTYGRLGLSDRVIGPAAREVGLSTTQLRARTVVTPLLGQPLIAVRVRGTSRREAVDATNAVAGALTATIRDAVRQNATLKTLRREFARANIEEERRAATTERITNRLGRLGERFDELSSAQISPLIRAQAQQQAAILRRIGIGSRYASIATTNRAALSLRTVQSARSLGSDRWSVAGLWGVGGAALGLLAGLVVGVLPPRRAGRRRRRTAPRLQVT